MAKPTHALRALPSDTVTDYEVALATEDGQVHAYLAFGGGAFLTAESSVGMRGVSLDHEQLLRLAEGLLRMARQDRGRQEYRDTAAALDTVRRGEGLG